MHKLVAVDNEIWSDHWGLLLQGYDDRTLSVPEKPGEATSPAKAMGWIGSFSVVIGLYRGLSSHRSRVPRGHAAESDWC